MPIVILAPTRYVQGHEVSDSSPTDTFNHALTQVYGTHPPRKGRGATI
jgi:hypothetical protein